MPDPFTLPQRLVVSPPLDVRECDLVAGLDLWPGRPRSRSPWTVCDDGCCLDLTPDAAPAATLDWLRFLLRELLSPRSTAARGRAATAGLADHRVDGRVFLGAPEPVLLAVTASRVRQVRLDDELFPVDDGPRGGAGDVVELRGHSTER